MALPAKEAAASKRFFVNIFYSQAPAWAAASTPGVNVASVIESGAVLSVPSVPSVPGHSACVDVKLDLGALSFLFSVDGIAPNNCIVNAYPQKACGGSPKEINVNQNLLQCKNIPAKSFELFC